MTTYAYIGRAPGCGHIRAAVLDIPARRDATATAVFDTAAAHIREDASVEWDGDDTRANILVRRKNLLKALYFFRVRHGHGLFDGPEGA